MTWNPHVTRPVRGAARARRPLPVVAAVLLALAERRPAVGGVLPRHRGLRRRLAVLLLRLDAGQEAAQPGIRRRRQEGRRRREAAPAAGRLPRAISRPNDLLFYDGSQFPERYRHGAFIAFHGSTIRMPYSQAGYIVAFVPMKDGKPSGDWEVFADGFAGIDPIPNTGDAAARPMGLAEGPDGSLYVSDSVKGKIWKVTYAGERDAFGPTQLSAMADAQERSSRTSGSRTSRRTSSAARSSPPAPSSTRPTASPATRATARAMARASRRWRPRSWVPGQQAAADLGRPARAAGRDRSRGQGLQRRDAGERLPERRAGRAGPDVPPAELRQPRAGRQRRRSRRSAREGTLDATHADRRRSDRRDARPAERLLVLHRRST